MAERERVELRCPVDRRRLFGVLKGPTPAGPSTEFACQNCRQRYIREGKAVTYVLHVFGPDGALQTTEVVRP